MQKIQKFQFGHVYVVPKSPKTYELLDRDGHRLTFLVRNPKTKDSWRQISTSTYKADQSGAFEEVLFSYGVRSPPPLRCLPQGKGIGPEPAGTH